MTNPDASSDLSITPLRRNLLRACYLLIVIGLALTAWPRLLLGGPDRLVMDTVVDSMLCAMHLIAIIALFSPIRMLPIMLFEVFWKGLWALVIALPLALRGSLTPGVAETLFAVAFAAPFVFIVPWGYVWRTYLRSAEPWRRARADA